MSDKTKDCITCYGRGTRFKGQMDNHVSPCSTCNGTGKVEPAAPTESHTMNTTTVTRRAYTPNLAQQVADRTQLPVPTRMHSESSRLLAAALTATNLAALRAWNAWGEHAMGCGASMADLRTARVDAICDYETYYD
jgi:hypothetical protein